MNKVKTFLIASLLALGLAGCASKTPAHVHNYTDAITTPATCTTDGVRTYTCDCGESYTEAVAATGHTEATTTEVTAATPDTAGKAETVVTCSVCNEEVSRTVVSEDAYTAASAVESVFALLTGKSVTAYSAEMSGVQVRYVGGNFGTTYTGEQLVGFAHNAITAKMTEFVVDEEPAADEDGDFGAVYYYANEATGSVVVMQSYAYASTSESNPGNILQILAYVTSASTL